MVASKKTYRKSAKTSTKKKSHAKQSISNLTQFEQAESTKKHHIKKKQEKKSPPPTNKPPVQRLYDMVKEQENIHLNLYKQSKFENSMEGDLFVVYGDIRKEVEHAIQSNNTDIVSLKKLLCQVHEEKTKRINNEADYVTSVTSYVTAAKWFTVAFNILLIDEMKDMAKRQKLKNQ